MKIFSLVAGVACIAIALLMFLIGSAIGGIILLLIGAVNLFLYVKNKNQPKQEETEYIPEALKYDIHDFPVAGFDYYQDVLSEMLTMENEEYMLPKSRFIEEVFDRCYQYDVEFYPARLEDEPQNEYDPNAIAVYVQGERIGYVAKKDQQAVKALAIDHIDAEVYGGKYKESDGDEITTGETPYKAMLHIYANKV